MPRRGENIYKRRDGRWEGRYIVGRKLDGRAITAPCMVRPTIPCGKSWRIARRKTEGGYYGAAL